MQLLNDDQQKNMEVETTRTEPSLTILSLLTGHVTEISHEPLRSVTDQQHSHSKFDVGPNVSAPLLLSICDVLYTISQTISEMSCQNCSEILFKWPIGISFAKAWSRSTIHCHIWACVLQGAVIIYLLLQSATRCTLRIETEACSYSISNISDTNQKNPEIVPK